MERHTLNDCNYLVTIYVPESECIDCYSCNSTQEVFQVFTDWIREAYYDIEEHADCFDNEADALAFYDYIHTVDAISNPEVIRFCFETLFYNTLLGLQYCVTRGNGSVWFSYGCRGIQENG